MAPLIASDQWETIRKSLRQQSNLFADLVGSVGDPQVKATEHWSVATTAAHVTAVAWLDAAFVLPDAEPIPVPGLAERLPRTTVDDIHGINELVLKHFIERRPDELGRQLREHVDRILVATEGRDPAEPVGWIGSSTGTLAGVLVHLLNEILIHGWDIARPTKANWSIAPQDAAQFLDVFIVGLATLDPGHLLDGGGRPRDRRIAVEFRSDYSRPVTLVLRNGRVTAEPPGREPDVKVSFDPVVFTLMMFGRVGKARAALTRKVVIGGRRPWLLPVFLRTLRVPT